jgi:hypothetical protein
LSCVLLHFKCVRNKFGMQLGVCVHGGVPCGASCRDWGFRDLKVIASSRDFRFVFTRRLVGRLIGLWMHCRGSTTTARKISIGPE